MKIWRGVASVCGAALLTTCPLPTTAADETATLRSIVVAEYARAITPNVVADLDGPEPVAARAALAIGRAHDVADAGALRSRLASHDAPLRAMSAYALGLLADSPSFGTLGELALHDASSAVRYAAVDAMGRILAADATLATEPAADELLAIAKNDGDPYVRGHAAAQLDSFRDAPLALSISGALEKLQSTERDPYARWHATWMIARGYAPLASDPFFASSLRDPSDLIRLLAVRALGRSKVPDAVALATSALGDPSWRVQYEAREALRRLHGDQPTEHLTAIPDGIHLPAVPPIPAADLGPIGPPSAIPSGLHAPDPAVFALEAPVVPHGAQDMANEPAGRRPLAVLHTTQGDVTVALYRAWAPGTVANFISLARSRYYDANRWFRIVPDFVVQTGDPHDDGNGDAGYSIPAELDPVEQGTGVISMGLNYEGGKALRDSAGTQFYLTLSPQLHLDRDFTTFGSVVRGFDVLAHLTESDRIRSIDVEQP